MKSSDLIEFVRSTVRVDTGEPAPTTRRDPPYAVFVAVLTLVGMVVTWKLGPVSPFHRPDNELLLFGVLGIVASALSRTAEGETMQFEYAFVITCAAAVFHGPLLAALLAAAVCTIGQWPQRRRLGGWHQILLGTSQAASNTLVEGWVFLGMWSATHTFLPSVLVMLLCSVAANIIINIGWAWAGERGVRNLLRMYSDTLVVGQIQNVFIAMGIAAASIEPLMVCGLLAPLITSKILESTERRGKEAEASLLIDTLTGVYNRRFFWQRMDLETEGWHARGNKFSVIMIDIDNFKSLNDTHGHLEGDQALVAAAEAIQASVRDGLVARYGGEEFGVILPGATPADALQAAERLRLAAEDALRPWGTSISLGVATAELALETAKTLTERADMGLYQSKRSGKNRATFVSGADVGRGAA